MSPHLRSPDWQQFLETRQSELHLVFRTSSIRPQCTGTRGLLVKLSRAWRNSGSLITDLKLLWNSWISSPYSVCRRVADCFFFFSPALTTTFMDNLTLWAASCVNARPPSHMISALWNGHQIESPCPPLPRKTVPFLTSRARNPCQGQGFSSPSLLTHSPMHTTTTWATFRSAKSLGWCN